MATIRLVGHGGEGNEIVCTWAFSSWTMEARDAAGLATHLPPLADKAIVSLIASALAIGPEFSLARSTIIVPIPEHVRIILMMVKVSHLARAHRILNHDCNITTIMVTHLHPTEK